MSSVPPPEGVDPDAQIRQWTPRAEAGDANAILVLSAAYLMKDDWATATLWARRVADDGNIGGMLFLAQILEQQGEQAEAQQWSRRAEEAHSRTPAGRSIARLRAPIDARFGSDPDPQQVRAAAETGDLVGMTALGMLLMHDDPQQAERWLTPPAEAGDTLAMFILGAVLMGRDDLEGAGRWLEQAAESGESVLLEALSALAVATGDEQKARHWEKRAQQAVAAEDDTE